MGLPDPIRSDVHHSFSVLIRIPKFSFFYYVFQLQQLIGERVHLSPANKKRGQRNADPSPNKKAAPKDRPETSCWLASIIQLFPPS